MRKSETSDAVTKETRLNGTKSGAHKNFKALI
jgi:hypothetical protein